MPRPDQATFADLFSTHLQGLIEATCAALAAESFDALVLHAGTPRKYFADDQEVPFISNSHFQHWTPMGGPHHLLVVRPGERPRLLRVAPEDFWYEQAPLRDPFWGAGFAISTYGNATEVAEALDLKGRVAYLGDNPEAAEKLGIAAEGVNPAGLVARLDWNRSIKSDYEVLCLSEACRSAAEGHRAAQVAFEAGGSELNIHHAYLAAAESTDLELPYTAIVALDEKGAILHYTGKRRDIDGQVLLIDSGTRCHGYASDITRTWARPGCDALFVQLIEAMGRMQIASVEQVRPGVPYGELHASAHEAIADLLHAHGILKKGGREAVEAGLTRPFFPHGLGHMLGLQVHDVAGHQKAPEGGVQAPPEDHPFLRTTRTLEAGMVLTIEPGIYFIEMLLRPHRNGPTQDQFDWELIDRLLPFGGIRIEDDILVTATGARNLTREHLPNG